MTFEKAPKVLLATALCGFFLLFLGSGFLVFASEQSAGSQKAAELKRIEEEWRRYQESVNTKYSPRIETHQLRLSELQKILEANLQKFDLQQKTTVENERALQLLQSRMTTLSGQLESLSVEYDLTAKKIKSIEEQIAVRESGLEKIMVEKEKVAVEAELQKQIVMDYFSLLQTDSESFAPSDIVTGLKVILSTDSFTKNLRDEMHLTALEKTARNIFHDLEGAMSQLEETDLLLSRERDELKKLHQRLQIERRNLAIQKDAQEALLEQTKGEEKRFAALLAESKAQMEESSHEIAALQQDVASLKAKTELLQQSKVTAVRKLSKEKIQELLRESTAAGEPLAPDDPLFNPDAAAENEKPFAWPVDPIKITAQFRDASYKKVFGMEHNAIDIRAPQGTEIKAPAAGYVYKAVDNGLGYSYITLIHANNLITVYGHVSGFNVAEGDIVQAFQTLGLTGGTPGTKGAGRQTTGAHLHFEVWKDGVAMNPLEYLPLDRMLPEDVPEELFRRELEANKEEGVIHE